MTTSDKIHTFTRTEFNQMADMGFFDDQRVELLEGEILDMSPQNEPHMYCVSELLRFFIENLPNTFQVRCQGPYAASDSSQPDPDVYVIPKPGRTPADHPTAALLAVEVADTTLARDRRKIPIYAAGGIQEYWIINLNARQIEQYTLPNPAEASYGKRAVLNTTDTLTCTTLPLPPRSVAEFFPS
jgi:Uma2 family endonuclease